MRSLLSRFATLLLLVAASVLPAHAVEIRAVRLWASPESTRVVLDLSGSAQHSLLVLKNPDRIVLDVAGARRASGSRARSRGERFACAIGRGRGQRRAHSASCVGRAAHRFRSGALDPRKELSHDAE